MCEFCIQCDIYIYKLLCTFTRNLKTAGYVLMVVEAEQVNVDLLECREDQGRED